MSAEEQDVGRDGAPVESPVQTDNFDDTMDEDWARMRARMPAKPLDPHQEDGISDDGEDPDPLFTSR